MRPVDAPILKRFRTALAEIYGKRLERVVLYGSRARCPAGFRLRRCGVSPRCARSRRLLEDGGEFIHAMAYPAGFYDDERMPLMYAIRAGISARFVGESQCGDMFFD
jgi:hypothetical protein